MKRGMCGHGMSSGNILRDRHMLVTSKRQKPQANDSGLEYEIFVSFKISLNMSTTQGLKSPYLSEFFEILFTIRYVNAMS